MPGPRDLPGEPVEDAYDSDYLREVASDEARQQRLEELKRRIELGAYHPDPRSIAEGLLSRAGEPEPRAEAEPKRDEES